LSAQFIQSRGLKNTIVFSIDFATEPEAEDLSTEIQDGGLYESRKY